jgi:hypothetical protein
LELDNNLNILFELLYGEEDEFLIELRMGNGLQTEKIPQVFEVLDRLKLEWAIMILFQKKQLKYSWMFTMA